jgi:uncharacterized protein (DUF2062 family)
MTSWYMNYISINMLQKINCQSHQNQGKMWETVQLRGVWGDMMTKWRVGCLGSWNRQEH